jgi:hypothetical protein
MADSQGFWSYVHDDDEADSGRIARLARDVADQFQMLTGETISLFLDKDAIKWGEEWRDKVDSSLSSIAFFISVITPRYFMHPECRRELRFFVDRATRLGIRELVLPLLYVDVPSLDEEVPTDDPGFSDLWLRKVRKQYSIHQRRFHARMRRGELMSVSGHIR